jgi:LPXTG-motif cell wall-anchored protein
MAGWIRSATGATAASAALFGVALLPRATWALIDPDVWWHIRAGEAVLDSGSVPKVDSWSLTASGHPWTSQDWLSNVLLALGYRLGHWGMTLLSLCAAAVVVAAFAMLWSAVGRRRPTAGWFARVVWFSAALVLAGPVLGVKVQVLDLFFAAAVLWLLWHIQAGGRLAWLALLPLIALAWVNLHAGWLLLFVLGGAVLVGEGLDRVLRRPLLPEPMAWSRLAWLALALMVSALVLSINPNGTAIYGYPGYTAGIGALADFVGEWQRASLSNLFGWLLLGFVLLGVVPTFVLAWRTIRLADALILLGVTAMSVIAVRFLLITGPVSAAIIAVNLAPSVARTSLGRRLSPTLERLGQPRTGPTATINLVLVGVILLAGLGLAFARAVPATQAAEIEREFPVAAVSWLKDHDTDARFFNKFEWGGYLGLLIPDRPNFIDGRADVYGDAVIREYVSVIGLDGSPEAILDKYSVNRELYPPGTALANWLDDQSSWRRVYTDDVAVVWSRANDP